MTEAQERKAREERIIIFCRERIAAARNVAAVAKDAGIRHSMLCLVESYEQMILCAEDKIRREANAVRQAS